LSGIITGDAGLQYPTGWNFQYGGGSTSALYINSSGNVGINETSPSSYGKLVVSLGGASGNVLALQKDSGPGIAFYGTSYAIKGLIESINSSGDMVFYTQNGASVSERMRILSDGKIGIGITNPTVTMHIHDTAGPTIRLTRGSNRFEVGAGFDDLVFTSRDSATAIAAFDGFAGLEHRFSTGGGSWKSLGSFNVSSDSYLHIKTSLTVNDSRMTMFRATGYYPYSAYGHGYIGCYLYTGTPSAPYGSIIANLGNHAVANNQYYSSSGSYWVIVLYWPSAYNSPWLEYIAAGNSYGDVSGVSVLAYTWTSSNTGAY